MQSAAIQAAIINFSMCRPKEPITINELMGVPKPEETEDEIAARLSRGLDVIAFRTLPKV